MTDAFRCDGCGEYYDEPFKFVSVSFKAEAVRYGDFDMDDIGAEAYTLANEERSGDDCGGEYCPTCGRDVLEDLIDRFDGGED